MPKSSFRDPSGYVEEKDGKIFRHIDESYYAQYAHLIKSGLYTSLTLKNLLIKHGDIRDGVIEQERIPFVSYPYSWSFNMLKDAALLTLKIQEVAMNVGMTLKDASAYNVQFIGSNPIFIDTLSFDFYKDGSPWVAYKQFCQHFLAPLALASYVDTRLIKMSQLYIDGIPLDLVVKMLPLRARFNMGIFLHLYLHAWGQGTLHNVTKETIADVDLIPIIDSLKEVIKKMKPKSISNWGNYYSETNNYSDKALEYKTNTVRSILDAIKPKLVWDLGANTGMDDYGHYTVSIDSDELCVNELYLKQRDNVLPLVIDLVNPSPSLGWNCEERSKLWERGKADVVLALALIHHLAIGNNVPLNMLAEFFANIGDWMVIEFVPKVDSNCMKLLINRQDIYDKYNRDEFEKEFNRYFNIIGYAPIPDSNRTLYLMRKK